jgi:hypothetical protein
MTQKLTILLLFILLVVTIISGFYFIDFNFSSEGFTSSSEKSKGQGIGNSFAAPLDLAINTDNTNVFDIPTNF